MFKKNHLQRYQIIFNFQNGKVLFDIEIDVFQHQSLINK
jgi:hypothetical protein